MSDNPAGRLSSRLGLSWACPYDPSEDRNRGVERKAQDRLRRAVLDGKEQAPEAENVGEGPTSPSNVQE